MPEGVPGHQNTLPHAKMHAWQQNTHPHAQIHNQAPKCPSVCPNMCLDACQGARTCTRTLKYHAACPNTCPDSLMLAPMCVLCLFLHFNNKDQGGGGESRINKLPNNEFRQLKKRKKVQTLKYCTFFVDAC